MEGKCKNGHISDLNSFDMATIKKGFNILCMECIGDFRLKFERWSDIPPVIPI